MKRRFMAGILNDQIIYCALGLTSQPLNLEAICQPLNENGKMGGGGRGEGQMMKEIYRYRERGRGAWIHFVNRGLSKIIT